MTDQKFSSVKDYEIYWDPNDYLNEHYTLDQPHHKWRLETIKRFFDTIDRGDGRLLDIGTGPTLSSLISAAMKFDTIYVSDVSKNNIDELNKFVRGDAQLFDWTPVFKYVAKLYENEPDWLQLKKQLQRSIKGVLRSDVLQEDVLFPNKIDPVDVLMTSLCIESATKDSNEYFEALKRMVNCYLKPGGTVILLVACEETYYNLAGKVFRGCTITREQIIKTLKLYGFVDIEMEEFGFETDSEGNKILPNEEADDAAGYVLVKATKI